MAPGFLSHLIHPLLLQHHDAVLDALLCTNCWAIVKTVHSFKKMCLENEEKLAEYLRATQLTRVNLKDVVDSKKYEIIINNEHDYTARGYEDEEDETPLHSGEVEQLLSEDAPFADLYSENDLQLREVLDESNECLTQRVETILSVGEIENENLSDSRTGDETEDEKAEVSLNLLCIVGYFFVFMQSQKKPCSVLGCKSVLPTHRLPMDLQLYTRWLAATGNPALCDTQNRKNARICRKHFEAPFLIRNGVSPQAIPTLYLPGTGVF